MIEITDALVERVGKALHQHHGRGYCSMGAHQPGTAFACWDEARIIIKAIQGEAPSSYPGETGRVATLAARQAARQNRERVGKATRAAAKEKAK